MSCQPGRRPPPAYYEMTFLEFGQNDSLYSALNKSGVLLTPSLNRVCYKCGSDNYPQGPPSPDFTSFPPSTHFLVALLSVI
jgi:hypothetical protein